METKRSNAPLTPAVALASIPAVCTLWAFAGPLNPPAGPVTATHKTLSEIEPRIVVNSTNTPGDADSLYHISQPGSYVLAGNLVGVAFKHGIEIQASHVRIDLRGFNVIGGPNSLSGVALAPTHGDVSIMNGMVSDWGEFGIDCSKFNTFGTRACDVTAYGNVLSGIRMGENAEVRRCVANSNGGAGIAVGAFGIIDQCRASSNQQVGFEVGTRGLVESSFLHFSNDGAWIGDWTSVRGCLFADHSGRGLIAGSGCVIEDCTFTGNGGLTSGGGLLVNGNHGRIDSNSFIANKFDGLSVANGTVGNLIVRNQSYGNSGFQYRVEGLGATGGVSGPGRNEFAPLQPAAPTNGGWPAGNNHPWGNFMR